MRTRTTAAAAAILLSTLTACGGSSSDAKPRPTVTVTATETAELSDECRAWIEGELLDSSDSIEATDGYSACGDLSDEELDQAIEQVTDDLIEQGVTTP
ncbi:hypothetical protein [Streptomyces sp. NPDC002994]|uniref:hypothetical protein n=1 Tax=Streptomyces sp. NPDC002994 TaxID=3154441 RepID=UPI00339F9721